MIHDGEFRPRGDCFFIDTVIAVLTSIGVDAGTAAAIAPAVGGALVGGAGGAALDAVTGKPILPGIAEGALTGGAIGGVGPLVGNTLGLGATAGDVLVGAGAGAASSAAFGGNAGIGALEGAGSGLLAGFGSDFNQGLSAGVQGGPPDPNFGGLTPGAVGGAGGAPAPSAPIAGAGIGAAASAAPSGAAPFSGDFGGPSFLGATTSTPTIAPGDLAGAYAQGGPSTGIYGGASPGQAGGANLFSETNPSAAATVGNALSGANAINEVPALASAGDSGGFNLGSIFNKSNLPLLAGGGLIASSLLRGNMPVQGQTGLNTEAGQLAAQGQQLQSYLNTGTLPPGVQASITQAADAAKARIRSQYASMGGSSSAMEQDLASVDQQAATQGAQIATQLLSQGVTDTELSSQIYTTLMNNATQQNAALGSAISNLARSAAGVPTVFALQGING
jgi:hypothetical protein